MENEQGAPDLRHMLAVLRRRAPVILLCFVVAAGAAYGFSKRQARKYTATASLVFNNNQLNQQVAGLQAINSGGSQAPEQQTNVKLVQLGDMAAKTAKQLDHGLTRASVNEALSVSAQGESNIVDVSATATSPTLATDIANYYTEQFVKEQQSTNRAYYVSALALVNKELATLSQKQRLSPAGVALENRAQSLGVLAELHNGNVEIAQPAAVPTEPSSPKTSRNTVLGALLGLLLGVGIAFLLERVDRRVREPEDLAKIYGLPLLGVIPESKALRGSTAGQRQLTPGEVESFHLIRAHLRYFNVDREVRTIMVASAAPGDGKTTIARNLAAAAARMGSRVLLIEADLRRPTLSKQLDLPPGPGLADVLIGAVRLDEAKRGLPVGSADESLWRGFDVLVAGAALPPNPAQLVESRAMSTILENAKQAYDLVVVDTPPLTAVSDAFPLLRKVDGVIIVGRVGRNRRDIAQGLRETLSGAGAPLLGVVANGVRARGSRAYAYSYDYAPASTGAPDTAVAPSDGASVNGAGQADRAAPTAKG